MANNNKSDEQKSFEADVESFRKDLGPFVVAAETTRMPMIFTDAKEADNPIIFANESFLALTGYSRDEVLGQDVNFMMADDGADLGALAQVEAAYEGTTKTDPQIRYRRKDGTMFWAVLYVCPVRDDSGDVVQHFVSFVDLTEHKQEEERLQFLLDELNHRTQNMLATVQAIAVQTLRGEVDEEVVDVFEGRLLALSKAHGLLGQKNWEGVSLRDILDQILQPFGLNDRHVARFSVEGDDVRLQPRTALTLAMLFHELATNAAKHGALSNGAGRIDIVWHLEPTPHGDRMRLCWQESGGPPVAPSGRKGFGSTLIARGLPQELDAEILVVYEPGGVICHIGIPVPRATRAEGP